MESKNIFPWEKKTNYVATQTIKFLTIFLSRNCVKPYELSCMPITGISSNVHLCESPPLYVVLTVLCRGYISDFVYKSYIFRA